MRNIRVTGIISTLRSKMDKDAILSVLSKCELYEHILENIYVLGNNKEISNSEGLLMAALFGLKEAGVNYDVVNLKNIFSVSDDSVICDEEANLLLEESQGFIMSTPVYFGDRGSLLADFIKFCKKSGKHFRLPLDKKAVGIVSVGAKRNGGQETTNIFALWECLEMGAAVVGNGPPTSQYGGTGWAGNVGAIIDDNFGIETSIGTGRRVGVLAKVLNLSLAQEPKNIKILFLITGCDEKKKFINEIEKISFPVDVSKDIIDITELKIERCLACSTCPGKGILKQEYRCVISDDMVKVYNRIIQADCIVIAHYYGSRPKKDRFQIFMERTRFIRRNHFELTDKIFSFIGYTDRFADIFPLRVMTSFLRHNMFLIGPFYIRFLRESGTYSESIPLNLFVERLVKITAMSKIAREIGVNKFDTRYVPIGYTNR